MSENYWLTHLVAPFVIGFVVAWLWWVFWPTIRNTFTRDKESTDA